MILSMRNKSVVQFELKSPGCYISTCYLQKDPIAFPISVLFCLANVNKLRTCGIKAIKIAFENNTTKEPTSITTLRNRTTKDPTAITALRKNH